MTAAIALPVRQGSAEWLEMRKTGIGSSDMPIIAGESPYQSPLELWAAKTGLVPATVPDDATRRLMDIGTRMEPVLLDLYEAETGRKARRVPRMLVHPQYPWARASLDAEAPVKRIVEAKWTHARRWSAGDAVPADVVIQVQWQMFVAGRDVADVVALVGPELRVVEVARDQSMIDDLLYLANDFWRHVTDRIRPAIDGSESTRRTLVRMHPADDGTYLSATPDLIELADRLRAAKAAKTAAEDAEKTVGNAIRAMVGDASGVEGLLTYRKSADSTRTNWPAVASAYRGLLSSHETAALDAIESIHSETSHGPRVLRLSKETSRD